MSNILIAFYSRADENYVGGALKKLEKGNTEVAAEMIQKLTGGELFYIRQVQEYSESYNECIAQAQADQKRDARPELLSYPEGMDKYDVIYLGFPNYWGTMPMAVFTFLEHFDFAGKTVKPFCTHEGSGMGRSLSDIRKLCKGAEVDDGIAVYGSRVDRASIELEKWCGSTSL